MEIRKEVEKLFMDLYKERHFVRPLIDGMEFDRISSMKNFCFGKEIY